MVLDRYGYSPGKDSDRRRTQLKKAIQNTSFDLVYRSLKEKKETAEGYKIDRIEWDLNWLKNNSKKYYTEILNGHD